MNFRKNQMGAAMVEFAIILPLFVVLIFGVIEFSLMLYDQALITNASREGARSGIALIDPRLTNVTQGTTPTLTAYVTSVVSTYCGNDGNNANNLVNFTDAQCNTSLYSNYPTTINTSGASLTPLSVKVDYTYHFLVFPNLIKLLKNGTFTNTVALSATTVMNFE